MATPTKKKIAPKSAVKSPTAAKGTGNAMGLTKKPAVKAPAATSKAPTGKKRA